MLLSGQYLFSFLFFINIPFLAISHADCLCDNHISNFSPIFRLPVPWLLYGIFFLEPVKVSSCGMVCSIAILFMMLLFVVMSIACFRWRMNKGLGVTMFILYFVFVAISLMFEYKHLTCPF